MAALGEPPPGGGEPPPNPDLPAVTPEDGDSSPTPSPAVTPTEGGSTTGNKKQLRTFAEIIADAKENRNILVIKLAKKPVVIEGVRVNPEHLDYDKIGELLFDILGLKVEDCERVAWTTSRWDTKEVQLKKNVDASPYMRPQAFLFYDHYVTVSAMSSKVTEVTFRNVPLCIPDEEIINICECYGEPINNEVYCKASAQMRGATGSTRYVKMKLNPGTQFENFYWVEGPLDQDQGGRITVTHEGQISQCSNCLKREGDCRGFGKGKLCKDKKEPRADMKKYMRFLQEEHGYTSLKTKFKREFPLQTDNDGFGHIVDEELEDPTIGGATALVRANPEEADATIATLREQLSEANAAREQSLHEIARLKTPTLTTKNLELGLNKSPAGQVNIRADIFEYNEENDTVEVIDEESFQEEIEKKCKVEGEGREMKMQHIRNRLLSQVRGINRQRLGRRTRRDSTSSVTSVTSGIGSTRERSPESDQAGSLPAKSVKLASGLPIKAKQ